MFNPYQVLNPNIPVISQLVSRDFILGRDWAPGSDPLVLDLDGGGIATSAIDPNAPILFDQNGDGIKTGTGWIGAGEGLVVRDLNGNGVIDSGRELFGDNTILTHGPNAGQTAANGFEALADLDADASGVSDGKFDSSDVAFASVKLWKDLNQDGISQSGELFTFAELGVQSIKVTGADDFLNLPGGTQTHIGSFTRTDGQTGSSGTINLAGNLALTNNNFYRQFSDDPALTAEAAALPQMRGSGLVRDLRQAMSLGTAQAQTLREKVAAFSAATTRDAQLALLDQVIAAWGETADQPTRSGETSPSGYDHHIDLSYSTSGPWQDRFGAVFGAALDAKGYDWRNTDGTVAVLGDMLLAAGIVKGYRSGESGGNVPTVSIETWSKSAADVFAEKDPSHAAHVRVLEDFNGEAAMERWLFISAGGSGSPVSGYEYFDPLPTHNFLEQAYSELSTSIYDALVVQTRLQPYLDGISLVIDEGGIRFDNTALAARLDATMAADLRNGLSDLADLNLLTQTTLQAIGFDGMGRLRAAVEALPPGSPVLAELASWRVVTSGNYGTESAEIYLGDAESNLFLGRAGNDLLDGGAGDDSLGGEAGNDILKGGAGNDYLQGDYWETGNDILDGGVGNDYMVGGAGNDILDGGVGNDILDGGAGNDTYLFGLGYGQDAVWDTDGADVIKLGEGITTANVRIWRDLGSLHVGIEGATDVLTVQGWFDATTNRVESIVLDDGTAWGATALEKVAFIGTAGSEVIYAMDGNNELFGLGGDDQMYADMGDDMLDGGTGNDYMEGGTGNDTYIFALGYGLDTVWEEEGADVIKLGEGLTTANVHLWRDASSLYVGLVDATDVLTVQGWFDATTNRVESIEFADGTVWDEAALAATVFSGTSGADAIYGTSSDNVLDGGVGDDYLDGGAGNDTYIFGLGYGQDTVWDVDGADVIKLGEGITTANVRLWRDTSSLYVSLADTSDMLTVPNWFDATANRVEGIEFADGTVWDEAALAATAFVGTSGADAIYGTSNDDTLHGVGGDDYLYGDAGNDLLDGGTGGDYLDGSVGNDTYIFGLGYGQDTVWDTDGADIIKLGEGLTAANVRLWRDTSNLYAGLADTSDVLTVQGWFDASTNRVESIQFADGTVWDEATLATAAFGGTSGADALYGTTNDDTLYGVGGDDYLYGDAGNDLLDGGTGDDYLDGGAGNDTYLLGRGDGADTVQEDDATAGNTDVLEFLNGISSDQIWLRQVADNLEVSIIGSTDKATLTNWYLGDQFHVEQFKTSDGKTLLDSQVQNLVSAMAAFSPPPAGQTTLSASYAAALTPVIAANWQ